MHLLSVAILWLHSVSTSKDEDLFLEFAAVMHRDFKLASYAAGDAPDHVVLANK